MSERQDIHVHVENDEQRRYDEPARYDDPVASEERAAAGFFTAQVLWILLIVLIVVLIAAALGSGVVDLNGSANPVEPTAAP